MKRVLCGAQISMIAALSLLLTIAVPTEEPSNAKVVLPDIYAYRADDLATLREGFHDPPREAGPWLYCFWFDNVVSRAEITRELEEIAAAGFAGV